MLFDFQQTRRGEHSCRFLKGFSGYLHVDGYSGYEKLTGVTLVGCWVHARRKFDEALTALQASATIYSIVGTALANGLHPRAYLAYLFERLPNVDLKDPSVIDGLLPWSALLPPDCRHPSKDKSKK